MRKRRCSLCGGKLVHGKCIECGLDNSKNDTVYQVNKGRCENQPLTHAHSIPQETHESASKERVKKMSEKWKQSPEIYARRAFGIFLLVAVCGVGLYQILQDSEMVTEEDYRVENYDPYEYVNHTLPEDGEIFQEVFEGGEYVVGVHIPEGQYRVDWVSGYGSVSIEDDSNSIYYSEYLSDEVNGGMAEVEDFRLFTGAKLMVHEGVRVRLTSENAQTAKLSGIANPLTECIEIRGEKTAGEDNFPAGVYDVSFLWEEESSETGHMRYIVPGTLTEEEIEEYDMSTGDVLLLEQGELYHNVVLPEGTVVEVEEGVILLIPSEKIESEDYAGYYENMYI